MKLLFKERKKNITDFVEDDVELSMHFLTETSNVKICYFRFARGLQIYKKGINII